MASQFNIVEAAYPSIEVSGGYPIVASDNIVVSIEANNNYVIGITSKNNQYIYNRGNYKSEYLLHKGQLRTAQTYLEPYSDAQIVISTTAISLNQLTSGYLSIKGSEADRYFSLIGRSGNQTCEVAFSVVYLESKDKIYEKKSISSHKFSLKSTDQLYVPLNEYFGGSDLKYTVGELDPHLSMNLRQIKKIKVNTSMTEMENYQIVGINVNKFYLIGVKQPSVIVQLCKVDNEIADCEDYYQSDDVNSTVSAIHGARRYNGQKILIFGLSYDQVFRSLNLDDPKFSYVGTSTGYQYSQVLIGQKYTFFCLKKDNTVTVQYDL